MYQGAKGWEHVPPELVGLGALAEEDALARLCASELLLCNDLFGFIKRARRGLEEPEEEWLGRCHPVRSKLAAFKPVLEELYAR